MSLRETGKQRAKRIDQHVLQGTRWLERGRIVLAAIAAVGAFVWWGAGLRFSRAEAWASPGPVAAVHSTWENDCEQCHTDFHAIRSDAFAATSDARRLADAKCQNCHQVSHNADPLGRFGHHALVADLSQIGCATCHQEHRGVLQSLVRTSDNNCTICHGRSDLAQSTRPLAAESPLARSQIADIKVVTQFSAAGHPYFRSLGDPELGAKSPRLVARHLKFAKFSHHVHMMPGMALDPEHQPIWTLEQIPESDRSRYAMHGQRLSDPVRLTCASCHQADARGFGTVKIDGLPAAALPADSSGAYMLPIAFENQCRACHALTIEPVTDPNPRDQGAAIPHRLSADELLQEVRRYWGDKYLKSHPLDSQAASPVPGSQIPADDLRAIDFVRNGSRISAAHLNRECGLCHELIERKSDVLRPAADALVDAVIPQVAPVDIPQKFLLHARFNHSAHRAVDCKHCHQECYPDGDATIEAGQPSSQPELLAALRPRDEQIDSEPPRSALMIVNRDTCLECHGPRRETAAGAIAGARYDCVECHQFHSREDAVWQSSVGQGAHAGADRLISRSERSWR
jgi:hypothetical protein